MKDYIVKITTLESTSEEWFAAKNGKDAIAQAKRFVAKSGHTKDDGPVEYTAMRA